MRTGRPENTWRVIDLFDLRSALWMNRKEAWSTLDVNAEELVTI
jgi:hypothetical protein